MCSCCLRRRRLRCDRLARSLRSWVATSHWSNSARVHVRCGSSSRSTRLTWGRVIWGIFFPPVLLKGQLEGAREQGQGEVMVPAGPTAHLVLIQPRLSFGRLVARLTRCAVVISKGALHSGGGVMQARPVAGDEAGE